MKKWLLFLFLFFPVPVFANSARNMIAMDMDTHRILYEKNAHDVHLIASISKIMTAIVAIEQADIESDVTTTPTILKAFGSGIYIEVGETMKLKDLLYGLMLRSGNDAALAIAEYVGGDVQNFVSIMNEYAKKIGMKNTKFLNPHGLEEKDGNGNTSTAYDMALLTSYAMENEVYREIVSCKKHVVTTDKKTYSWTNKNKLLSIYEYTTGGKTGFTEKARRTLVSTASKDDKNIVVVTLNDGNDWKDHIEMYDSLFSSYDLEKVIDKNKFEIKKEEYYKNENLYVKDDVYLLVTKKEKADVNLDINLNKLTKFKDGDVVGTIKIKLKDTVLKEVNVYVMSKEQKEGKKKSIWDYIIGWFKHD